MRQRFTFVAACAALLSSCGSGKPASTQIESSTDAKSIEASTPAPAPTPNFVEEEQGTYFYVAGISEEEKKKGKAAPDVLGFRYFGRNEKGQHVLAYVSDSGQILGRAYCSEPCAVIKYSDGTRVAYDPGSVIGSAFQDALNGLLKSANERASSDRASYPRTVSSIPKAYQGAWDEMTQDGCAGREARFVLDATKFYNFEVEWDVTKVDLLSANEMDLHTTTKDDNGNQVNEVWQFKLADGGKTLTSRKPGGTFFRRCPVT